MNSENPTDKNDAENDANPEADQHSQSAPQLLATTGIPPVQAPPSPYCYQITCKTEKDWRDKVKFCAEIVGLTVLIAYTVFSCLQWLQIRWTNRLTRESSDGSGYALQQTLGKMQGQIDQMHELATQAGKQAENAGQQVKALQVSNRINREALESAQRAFVNYGKLSTTTKVADIDGKEVPFLVNVIRWDNVGNTTAQRVLYFSGSTKLSGEPSEETFAHPPVITKPTYIGPKDYTTAIMRPMPISDFLVDVPPAKTVFQVGPTTFFWGWIVYRDAFQKVHLTEYCTFVTRVQGSQPPGAPIGKELPDFKLSLTDCGSHNCADQDCEDYNRIVKLAKDSIKR